MTALAKYQRLEASGLWRASAQAQRREVVVSIGDATLVISDMQDRALAHWSLAAIERANPGRHPAIFHPDGDAGETLELAADEAEMIAAIETLRMAVERRRPHPGRLRLVVVVGSLALIVAAALLWLPQALRDQAIAVLPEVKRVEIGAALEREIARLTGPRCDAPGSRAALKRLAARLPGRDGPGRLVVMSGRLPGTLNLPGGSILVGRALVEKQDAPDVVVGYLVAARLRAASTDPLALLLRESPLWASLRVLTTGKLSSETLRAHAAWLLTRRQPPLDEQVLLAGFAAWGVRARPYAYAVDPSGETTIGLIEADPYAETAPEPVLPDADWLRLQAICDG